MSKEKQAQNGAEEIPLHGKIVHRCIFIDKRDAEKWTRLLDMDEVDFMKEGVDENTSLCTYSTALENDYYAEIVVQSGQHNLWVDGILMKDGHEIGILEPAESLLGEYWFEINGNTYIVTVSPESSPASSKDKEIAKAMILAMFRGKGRS